MATPSEKVKLDSNNYSIPSETVKNETLLTSITSFITDLFFRSPNKKTIIETKKNVKSKQILINNRLINKEGNMNLSNTIIKAGGTKEEKSFIKGTSAVIWKNIREIPPADFLEKEGVSTICLNYHSFSENDLIKWAIQYRNYFINDESYGLVLFVNRNKFKDNPVKVSLLRQKMVEYGMTVRDYSKDGSFEESFEKFDVDNAIVRDNAISYVNSVKQEKAKAEFLSA